MYLVVKALAEIESMPTPLLQEILHGHFTGSGFTGELCLLHTSCVLLTLTQGKRVPQYYLARLRASFSNPAMSLPLTPVRRRKTIFIFIHIFYTYPHPCYSKIKSCCELFFFSKLDQRPPFRFVGYKTILVQRLVSI